MKKNSLYLVRNVTISLKYKCSHCKNNIIIPVEIESSRDYFPNINCQFCGKDINDGKLDSKIDEEVLNYFIGRNDYLYDTK